MDRSTELLGRRRIRIEGAQIRVIRGVAIGTPVTQEFTGVGVHDDDSLVSVSVPDEGLVAVLVEGDLRHPREVQHAVGVNSLSGVPHLHQETAVACELENMGIALAVPADPDVVLGVHLKTVIRYRPGVLVVRPTEVIHQIPLHIELQHVGGRFTTHGIRLIRPHVSLVSRIQRGPAVDDEDVVTRIDAHTNHVAQDPVVRKRFGPEGIDLKQGHFDHVLLRRLDSLLEEDLAAVERQYECEQNDRENGLPFHQFPPSGMRPCGGPDEQCRA